MKILAVVPFLNEERYLGTLLESLAQESRPPDRLLLVDDGSVDGSPALAATFARDHPYAELLRRPARAPLADRLADAPEWKAFSWALQQTPGAYDVVAKLDADLRLTGELFAEIERCFEDDPRLGMAGSYLVERSESGALVRHWCPRGHVEGATKFYRHTCLEAITPIPAILGWDTIDEVRARLHGWRTQTFEIPSGPPEHLRRMGSYDGILRGFRRAGAAAWGYGAHPGLVVVSAIARMRARPPILCGAHYLAGWAAAAWRRAPRAEPAARELFRHEQLMRMRWAFSRSDGRPKLGR